MFSCRIISFASTFPSSFASKASWKALRSQAFRRAKQCVSAGCMSQVGRAGTHETQIFARVHAAKNLRPRCALHESTKSIGWRLAVCPERTSSQRRAITARTASFTQALVLRSKRTFGSIAPPTSS